MMRGLCTGAVALLLTGAVHATAAQSGTFQSRPIDRKIGEGMMFYTHQAEAESLWTLSRAVATSGRDSIPDPKRIAAVFADSLDKVMGYSFVAAVLDRSSKELADRQGIAFALRVDLLDLDHTHAVQTAWNGRAYDVDEWIAIKQTEYRFVGQWLELAPGEPSRLNLATRLGTAKLTRLLRGPPPSMVTLHRFMGRDFALLSYQPSVATADFGLMVSDSATPVPVELWVDLRTGLPTKLHVAANPSSPGKPPIEFEQVFVGYGDPMRIEPPSGAKMLGAPRPSGPGATVYQRAKAAEDQMDYAAAGRDYRVACDSGYPAACAGLGYMTEKGQAGPADTAEARVLFAKACDAGHAPTCFTIGYLTWKGLGGPADTTAARALFVKACDGGTLAGCIDLGIFAMRGFGGPLDAVLARALFTKSCDHKIAVACTNLEHLNTRGAGGPGEVLAREVFKNGCDAGKASDCTNLGRYLETGVGGPIDAGKARSWYAKGCDGKNAAACGYLANMFEKGIGGSVDVAKAKAYYVKACAGGIQELGCAKVKP